MADDLLGRPIVTAADLDRMTPEQVEEIWQASVVTDPDDLPSAYVDMLRRRAERRLAQREEPSGALRPSRMGRRGR